MWWDEKYPAYPGVLQYDALPSVDQHLIHSVGWLASDIISCHLTSPSMLCILSIQDWLATDEALRLPDANAERGPSRLTLSITGVTACTST